MELKERNRSGLRFVREHDPDNPAIVETEERSDGMTTFSGYLLRWGDQAHIRDAYGEYNERFAQRAFTKTFNERGPRGNRSIKMLRNHNREIPQVGKWLDLWEDSLGPAFQAETVPTSVGKDTAVEIREGILNTMSIGFDSLRDEFFEDDMLFEVKEARMYEASPVLWPAYESATIDNVRSLEELVPIFSRYLTIFETGVEIPDEQIGHWTQIRSRIGQLLDGPREAAEEEQETTESVAPVTDHACNLRVRLKLAGLE